MASASAANFGVRGGGGKALLGMVAGDCQSGGLGDGLDVA